MQENFKLGEIYLLPIGTKIWFRRWQTFFSTVEDLVLKVDNRVFDGNDEEIVYGKLHHFYPSHSNKLIEMSLGEVRVWWNDEIKLAKEYIETESKDRKPKILYTEYPAGSKEFEEVKNEVYGEWIKIPSDKWINDNKKHKLSHLSVGDSVSCHEIFWNRPFKVAVDTISKIEYVEDSETKEQYKILTVFGGEYDSRSGLALIKGNGYAFISELDVES